MTLPMRFALPLVVLMINCVVTQSTVAAPPAAQAIGDDWSAWSGVRVSGDRAVLDAKTPASYVVPDGPRGSFNHGFRGQTDTAADWGDAWGVRFEAHIPDGASVTSLTVTLRPALSGGIGWPVQAKVALAGPGPHVVALPWSAFDFTQAGTAFLRRVKRLEIVSDVGGVSIGRPCVVRAAAVALSTDIAGKPAETNAVAEYAVDVANTTDRPQAVALSFVRYGWESMTASVEPASLTLAPGGAGRVVVKVNVSERMPPGGHERQVLQAVANGDAASATRLTLITTRRLPHPYVQHDAKRWDEVREKVKQHDWANAAKAELIAKADKWDVPEIARPPKNDINDNNGPFLFATQNEAGVMACGQAYQLTGDKRYAEKIAEFLRRLSDPAVGYPVTWRACNQSLVQEGHFFQHTAMAYDAIYDSGVFTASDHTQIHATLRQFLRTIELASEGGSINNWNLSEVTGAFYCALVMQDLVAAERFFSGPSGIKDQLAKGTMDDGWWYECSISYNMWCAAEFTQAALAYRAFGIRFDDAWLPANVSDRSLLESQLSGGNGIITPELPGKPFGMDPTLSGPNKRAYRTITDLWNSFLPFVDYRGVMFGVNDSVETKAVGSGQPTSGQPFEIAYYVFRDPAYAAMIKQGSGQRDLMYGVPELPEKTPERFRDNAHADNVGLAMLRSQTTGRPPREQIQAVLHYGTHGWAHGHFDRTNLLHLSRYGRSFYNPEMVWYGYEPFMYKFYVQNSVSHNMIVVDRKQQEPTPGHLRLFHTGKAIQATVVDTTARWSFPPYGGMVYDYVPVKTFEEKTWREGRHVPIPATQPAYGVLTEFTEPILQRRLMVVTDDYVLLADYAKGERPHVFENLLQIKGFEGLTAKNKTKLRHDAQWSSDPRDSAQFVTDAVWFAADAPAVAQFRMRWGKDADNAGTRWPAADDGDLRLGVHTLWPPKQEIMLGTVPENHDVQKRLFYAVRGDGKTLAEGKVGAWILGQGDIDVPLTGVKSLELETRTELSKKPTLFWAGAVVVTEEGREIPLTDLPAEAVNVVPTTRPNVDYAGGPVKIVGRTYASVIAAEPKDATKTAVIRVDLSGLKAVRLKAVIGGDYPVGDEAQRRNTFAVRSDGKSARFLTVIEPYERESAVVSAVADGPDTITVTLADGRTQRLTIRDFEGDGSAVAVTLTETKDGRTLREETAAAGEK